MGFVKLVVDLHDIDVSVLVGTLVDDLEVPKLGNVISVNFHLVIHADSDNWCHNDKAEMLTAVVDKNEFFNSFDKHGN